MTLRGMPRATYQLVAKGPGFGLSSPATLTKPLVARLLLLSWVDLAAVAGFVVLFVIGLPLLGGRIRRRKDGTRLPVWHVGQPPDLLGPPGEAITDPETEVGSASPDCVTPDAQEPPPGGAASGEMGDSDETDLPLALANTAAQDGNGAAYGGNGAVHDDNGRIARGAGVGPDAGTLEAGQADRAGKTDQPPAYAATLAQDLVKEAARLAWERRSALDRRGT